jgi:HSP20 family protein
MMNIKSLVPWMRHRSAEATRYSDNEAQSLLAFHREMRRVFNEFFRDFDSLERRRADAGYPTVELSESEEQIKVVAELPGMEERDVEVTFGEGVLRLKGEKKLETQEPMYSERWSGAFERLLPLGDDVDAERIKASFRNGVLTITLAKKPEAQRQVRRIAIH